MSNNGNVAFKSTFPSTASAGTHAQALVHALLLQSFISTGLHFGVYSHTDDIVHDQVIYDFLDPLLTVSSDEVERSVFGGMCACLSQLSGSYIGLFETVTVQKNLGRMKREPVYALVVC
jgi:hypothetical protein